jgi:hypothetical protein
MERPQTGVLLRCVAWFEEKREQTSKTEVKTTSLVVRQFILIQLLGLLGKGKGKGKS